MLREMNEMNGMNEKRMRWFGLVHCWIRPQWWTCAVERYCLEKDSLFLFPASVEL